MEDVQLAKQISISFLPGDVRRQIETLLDSKDSDLRDYRRLGELLLNYTPIEMDAIRSNYNGESITGVFLNNAAKKGTTVGELYDILKKMDVDLLDCIDRASSVIVQRYRQSMLRCPEEGYDSLSSNCHCQNCYQRYRNTSGETNCGMNAYHYNENQLNLDHSAIPNQDTPNWHFQANENFHQTLRKTTFDYVADTPNDLTNMDPCKTSWIPPSFDYVPTENQSSSSETTSNQYIVADSENQNFYRPGHEPTARSYQQPMPSDEYTYQYCNQQQFTCSCQYCKRNTAPSGLIEFLNIKVSLHRDVQSYPNLSYEVQNHCSQVAEGPADEAENNDAQGQATSRVGILPVSVRPRAEINDKMQFVFLTGGQKEKSEKVYRLIKKCISDLETNLINVVADLSCGLYCSKDLVNQPVENLERESSLELLQLFFNKASCVVIAITPGYCKYIEEEPEAEASNHRYRARHVYTLMLNEYKKNFSKNRRFYPVIFKSKKICTEKKHIPHWMQSTLIYTYPKDNQNYLFKHLKEDLKSKPLKTV